MARLAIGPRRMEVLRLLQLAAGLGARVWIFHGLRLLPAVAALTLDWAYAVFWMASDVVLALAVRWLWLRGGGGRAAALLVNSASVFANVLLLLSLWLQGAGFNAQFFFHATRETLVWGYEALAPMFYACWSYWLLLSLWPFLFKGGRAVRRRHFAAVVSAGLVLNAPLVSLAWNAFAYAMEQRDVLLVPKPTKQTIDPGPLQSPGNLILIAAEGLEATYGLPEVFGEDATPALTALSQQGARFANMRQVSHTGWTMGAMVAVQCGFPMGPAGNFNSVVGGADLDALVPDAICLGDLLAAHGYRTLYMGGASLRLGGKGAFLAEHGFDERHGLQRLRPRLDDPSYVSALGVHDDSLFAFALDKLAELDGGTPFALALLTLDTHGPFGFPSASCGPNTGEGLTGEGLTGEGLTGEGLTGEGLLFAIRCADRLLADFIAEVLRRHPSALVVLLSDHLANFNDLGRPAPPADLRRLRFAVWGADVAPAVINRPGTHFDVMPTLMDLLGLDAWTEHNLGASLLRHDSPWFSLASPLSLRVVHSLPGVRLRPGDAVAFDPQGPVMEMDGHRILATGKGLSLRDAIFALEIDAAGEVAGVRAFPDQARTSVPSNGAAAAFTRWAVGRRIVGVSTNRAFNLEALDGEPAKTLFFVGEFGAENFVLAPLHARRTVAWPGAAK